MASLDSVRQKIFRSTVHSQELATELERYFKTNPAAVVRDPNSPPNSRRFIICAPEPVPARFGLIVGDCLQNLRSALDYLVWELVLAANKEPIKKNMFPICTTAKAFEDAIRSHKRLEGVDPAAVALIEGLQPYRAGERRSHTTPLAVLDDLVNINKHRRVLLTVLRGGPASDMQVVAVNGEQWGYGKIPVFNENTTVEIPAPSQVQVKAHAIVFVALNEGAAKEMEVTTLLATLQEYIDLAVIPLFAGFFS